MPLDLKALLSAREEIIERLGEAFDYQLQTEPPSKDWFSIDGISQYRYIGSEGAGGAFVELPDRRILYASSEGAAGIIALDFHAFIQLIVTHPYWRDMLHFSGEGKLSEMRRAAVAL